MAAYPLALMAAGLFSCLSCQSNSKAAPDHHTVAYAVTAHGRSDVGKVENCPFDRDCEIKAGELSFSVNRPHRGLARVSIYGSWRFGEPGFYAGMRDTEIDPSHHPIQLSVFAGKGQPRGRLVIFLNRRRHPLSRLPGCSLVH